MLKQTKNNNARFCDAQCKYLLYGFCIHPDYKDKGVKLKKLGNKFIMICSSSSKPKKQGKYRSRKVEFEGIVYDSELEFKRHQELKLLERAGKIKNLKYHVKYPLIDKNENGREINYEADFVYDFDGKTIVEDTKSSPTRTRLYMLKKRLMLERYGIKIKEYKKGDAAF